MSKQRVIAVRFPEELLMQIDEAAIIIAREHHVVIKRSGAIKMLIERALTEMYPYGGKSDAE